jgi:hypothetical protein
MPPASKAGEQIKIKSVTTSIVARFWSHAIQSVNIVQPGLKGQAAS